jgi:chaperonin cofactor prefoldin
MKHELYRNTRRYGACWRTAVLRGPGAQRRRLGAGKRKRPRTKAAPGPRARARATTLAISLLFFSLSWMTAGCPHGARSADDVRGPVQSDLRITRVVLYQSGVGYFERRGRVEGKLLHLRIRHDQVMDVLKSLTVVDTRSGGTVTVSLPAERSRLMEISQLPPQVRRSGGLLALAAAFRGATAIVDSDRGTTRGRLVGVENLGTEKEPDWRISLLSGDTLSSHRVAKIRSLRVLEKTLTVGLAKSLDVALNKGRWKPVRLTVRLSGEGPHDLVVSYVVPMPTWKPAYRLVVDDHGGDEGGGDGESREGRGAGQGKGVLLQGWSVVDNLSGEHWRRAKLSLTAGTPLAFKYDLYTPRDVERPDLTPRGVSRAVAPPPAMDATAGPRDKAGEARKPSASTRRRYKRKSKRSYRRRSRTRPSRAPREPRPKRERLRDRPTGGSAVTGKELEKSYRSLVSGRSVGSLFRYDIERPVTVPDRSSALVSLVSKRVPGADVLYYRVGSGRPNPYRAVRFRNTSGFVLERGPVTIYRSGAFVGEALGGRIEKGAVTFVPYSLEGRVIVHLSSSTRDEGLKLLTIRNGYMRVQTQRVARYTYKITDRTGERLDLYVARRRRSGWKVIKPAKVIQEKKLYYARIPLKASGVTKFTVKEATPVRRRLSVYDSRARKALALYLKGSEVPPALRKQLEKVQSLQDQVAELSEKMSTIKGSIRMLRRRQADIRENVKVLGKRGNRDLKRKLLRSLAEVEKQLNDLNRKWVVHNMKRSKLRQRLRVLFKMIKL